MLAVKHPRSSAVSRFKDLISPEFPFSLTLQKECYTPQENSAKEHFRELTNQGVHLHKFIEGGQSAANKIRNVGIHILFGDSGILPAYKTDELTPHVWLNEARYTYVTQEKEKSPLMRIHTLPNETKSQDYLEKLIKCMNELTNKFHEYHKETLKIFDANKKNG